MKTKICSRCKSLKTIDSFHKSKRDGLHYECKDCKRKYYEKNKEKFKLKAKNRRKNNPEYMKQYRIKNKKKIKLQRKKYCKESHKYRSKNDTQYKLRMNIRGRFKIALKGKYKTGSAIDFLGCSIDKFILWMEMRWKDGMSWDNYGRKGWHIDHIRPLSSFDLTKKEECIIACNFSNLQPLWEKDNFLKGDKIDYN